MVFFIIGIVAFILFIMNIIITQNRLRRVIVSIDIVVIGIILFTFILNALTKNSYKKYEEDYNVITGNVLSGIRYDCEDDNYYYVSGSYMFGSDYLAISKDTCECGPFVKIAGTVRLYIERGQNINYSNCVEIGGRSCYLAPAVVRIEPDFWEWLLASLIVGSITLFVSNLIVFLIFIFQKKWTDGKQTKG